MANIYGENLLTNSVYPTSGTGWAYSNVSFVSEAGKNFARLLASASMVQNVQTANMELEEIPLQLLLGFRSNSIITPKVPVYVELVIKYTDNTTDVFRRTLMVTNKERNIWVTAEMEITKAAKVLSTMTFTVKNNSTDVVDLGYVTLKKLVGDTLDANNLLRRSRNYIYNSSFERFDIVTQRPHFWSGGKSVSNNNYYGDRCLLLNSLENSYLVANELGEAVRPNPSDWKRTTTRFAFYHKGGNISFSLYDDIYETAARIDLGEGNYTYQLETGYSEIWQLFNLSIETPPEGNIYPKFTNTDVIPAYLDGVMLEPLYNNAATFYTDGHFSSSLKDAPINDIVVEFMTKPLEALTDITILFENEYSIRPVITFSVVRDALTANPAHRSIIVPDTALEGDYATKLVNGVLTYYGVYIKLSAPYPTADGVLQLTIIGRE